MVQGLRDGAEFSSWSRPGPCASLSESSFTPLRHVTQWASHRRADTQGIKEGMTEPILAFTERQATMYPSRVSTFTFLER